MLDINKYLQDQADLAKQRIAKNVNQQIKVSDTSINAAESVSRKQSKILKKDSNKEQEDVNSYCKPIDSADKDSDEDSEYFPSCDEEDEHNISPNPTNIKASKQNVKKIIDDGDTKMYLTRIEKWKQDIKAACSGEYKGSASSADVKYAITGNGDINAMQDLKNDLKIPMYIWKQLYKYQKTGVKWLWELHQVQAGGLLGDEMGLGKTVQIIAFLGGLSKSEIGSWSGLGPCVIVAPATVIYQWVSHFHYWCPYIRTGVLHNSGSYTGKYETLIRNIHKAHGVLLITYAGIVKYNKVLTDWKWHYCILDEGHKIRNPDTQVSKLARKFPASHRLLITGSPMQNSLMELWSLYDFIRPGLLGTQNAFMEHFALPITQGGYANATEFQEVTALEIAKALKDMIAPYILRRTKAEVQEHIKLPEKNEQVLFCSLSEEQRDLYKGYLMGGTVRSILDRESRYGDPIRARILVGLSTLRKICNHPDIYLYDADIVGDQVDEELFGNWKRSGKMTVVHSLLKIWQKQGHRCLIFTQSRVMLCILEKYLQQYNLKYLRMDGSVSVSQRQSLIKTFNENTDYLVFLATTRVGGLGINLTGADRVIIYDPDWNPATDTQAKERAWRIGQLRNVTVYRLLSAGTIEEKIYQRQVFKQLLSNKVLLDPNQKNVLTTSSLQGLFTLEEPNREGDTETPSLFKHTKVKQNERPNDSNVHLSGSVSFSKKKLEAMRKMAREISKKITLTKTEQSMKVEIDPRARYKQQRELLLIPPKVEDPEVNVIDEQVTNTPFENILSELDIINMHTKKNYEKDLINEVFAKQENDLEVGKIVEEVENHCVKDVDVGQNESVVASSNSSTNVKDIDEYKKNKCNKKRRRSLDNNIENLVSVKKIKSKKDNQSSKTSDDDYVLSKLFSKSTVKNALQHDEVLGLAEKEKIYKLKEVAARKARDAVRAIKCSTK